MKGKNASVFCMMHLSIAVIWPSPYFGTDDASPMINETAYTHYLDVVDRYGSSGEWSLIAQSGKREALSQYESDLSSFVGDGFHLGSLMELGERRLDELTRDRFGEWLVSWFFSRLDGKTIVDANAAVSAQSVNLTYIHDENGAIRKDVNGNPMLLPLSESDTHSAELDRWKSLAHGIKVAALDRWSSYARKEFESLVKGLGHEDRSSAERAFEMRLSDELSARSRELEATLALEESAFRRIRLKDTYSLRLESEGKSAGFMAEELIGRTERSIQVSIERLRDSIDSPAYGVGIVPIPGENHIDKDWRENFRSELDSGLRLWDAAIGSFLAKRSEWEINAGDDYAKARVEWDEAERTLMDRAKSWVDSFTTLQRESESALKGYEAVLQEERQKANDELDARIEGYSALLEARLSGELSGMGVSRDMMSVGEDGVYYWLESINRSFVRSSGMGDGAGMLIDCAKTVMSEFNREFAARFAANPEIMKGAGILSWIPCLRGGYASSQAIDVDSSSWASTITDGKEVPTSAMLADGIRNRLFPGLADSYDAAGVKSGLFKKDPSSRERLTSLVSDSFNAALGSHAMSNALYWLSGVFLTQRESLSDRYDSLESMYAETVAGSKANESTRLSDLAYLNGLVNESDDSWKTMYLDATRVELLRARESERFWRDEYEIAKAVYEYSIDVSSDRDTAVETGEKLRLAEIAYGQSVDAYRLLLDNLSGLGKEIDAKRESIDKLLLEANDSARRLSEAREEFSRVSIMSSYEHQDRLTSEFRNSYQALLSLRGLLGDGSHTIYDAAKTYAKLIVSQDRAEYLEKTSGAVARELSLIQHERESLAKMASFTFAIDDDWTESSFSSYIEEALRISPEEQESGGLMATYRQYSKDLDAESFRARVSLLVRRAQVVREASLSRRAMAVSCMLSSSPGQGYSSVASLWSGTESYNSRGTAIEGLNQQASNIERTVYESVNESYIHALVALSGEIDAFRDEHDGSLDAFDVSAPSITSNLPSVLMWSFFRNARDQGVKEQNLVSWLVDTKDKAIAIREELAANPSGPLNQGMLARFGEVEDRFHDGIVAYGRMDCDAYASLLRVNDVTSAFTSALDSSYSIRTDEISGISRSVSSWLVNNSLGFYKGSVLNLTQPEELWNNGFLDTVDEAIGWCEDRRFELEGMLDSPSVSAVFRDHQLAWFDGVSDIVLCRQIGGTPTEEELSRLESVASAYGPRSYAVKLISRLRTIVGKGEGSFRSCLIYPYDSSVLIDAGEGMSWNISDRTELYLESETASSVKAERQGSLMGSSDEWICAMLELAESIRQRGVIAEAGINASLDIKVDAAISRFFAVNDAFVGMCKLDPNVMPSAGFTGFVADNAELFRSQETLRGYYSLQDEAVQSLNTSGKALSLIIDDDDSVRKEIIDRLGSLIKSLEKESSDIRELLLRDISAESPQGYGALERSYRLMETESHAAANNIREAKRELRKAKDIYLYASIPYDEVDDNEDYSIVNPKDRYAEIVNAYSRSRYILETITAAARGVNDVGGNDNDLEYRSMVNERDSALRAYAATLELKAALGQAIVESERKMTICHDAYASILTESRGDSYETSDNEAFTATLINQISSLGNNARIAVSSMRVSENGRLDFSGDIDQGEGWDRRLAERLLVLNGEVGKTPSGLSGVIEALALRVDADAIADYWAAMSWEDFASSGGQTYSQYDANYIRLQISIPYTSLSRPETDGEVLTHYRWQVKNFLDKSLLLNYGAYDGGSLGDAILCGLVSEHVGIESRIDKLKSAYDRSVGTESYDTFKACVYLGLIGNGQWNMQEGINASFNASLFKAIEQYCHDRGVDDWPFNSEWHAMDSSASDCRKRAELADTGVDNMLSGFISKIRQGRLSLDNASQDYANLLNRDDTESPNTILAGSMRKALTALGEGYALDILRTIGLPQEHSAESRIEAVIRFLNDSHINVTAEGTDSVTIMDEVVVLNSQALANAIKSLSVYVYGNLEENTIGKAVRQKQLIDSYRSASDDFVESGILPYSLLTENVLDEWAQSCNKDGEHYNEGRMLEHVEGFINVSRQYGLRERQIREIDQAYEAWKVARGGGKGESLETVRQKFLSVIESYMKGHAVKEAMASVRNPAFNVVQHELSSHESLLSVLASLRSSETSIKDGALDCLTELIAQHQAALARSKDESQKEVYERQWDVSKKTAELDIQKHREAFSVLFVNAQREWSVSGERMGKARSDWAESYLAELRFRSQMWDEAYLECIARKDQWLTDCANKAVRGDSVHLDPRGIVLDYSIPDLLSDARAESIVEELVGSPTLSGYLSKAQSLGSGSDHMLPVYAQGYSAPITTREGIRTRVTTHLTDQSEEIKRRIALVRYNRALSTLADAGETVYTTVEKANDSAEMGFRKMLLGDGFLERNGDFIKNTLVGATFLSTLTKDHVIGGYKRFTAGVIDLSVGLVSKVGMLAKDFGEKDLNALLEEALGTVSKKLAEFFGSKEDGVSGSFTDWVGFAPVFVASPDSSVSIDSFRINVAVAGLGETERIVGQFTQHKVIETAGHAEARLPSYSKRLWDDEGSWFEAPTLRTVIDVASMVISNACLPGVGGFIQRTLLSLTDDALFSVLDVGNGMSPLVAAESLAKKAIGTAGFSSMGIHAIGQSVAGIGGATGSVLSSLTDTFIGSTILSGAAAFVDNTAHSAMSSFSLTSLISGRDFFDENQFWSSSFGTDAMGNAVAAAAGHATYSGLMGGVMGNDGLNLDYFNSRQIQEVSGLTGLVAGLASSGVSYGITGHAVFNPVSIAGVGVLEVHAGGSKHGMNLGTNGTDVSIGTLQTALGGLSHLSVAADIDAVTKHSNDEYAKALALTYGFGDGEAKKQLEEILSGSVTVSESISADYTAKTVATEQGKRISIGDLLKDNPSSSAMYLGLVLLHESQRDGLLTSDNGAETTNAVLAHTEALIKLMADPLYHQEAVNLVDSNPSLREDLQVYAATAVSGNPALFSAYTAMKYDSSGDFWRVMKDENGNIVKVQDDGDKDHITIVTATGEKKVIDRDYSVTLSTQMAQINGDVSEAGRNTMNNLMWISGLNYSKDQGWHARNEDGVYIKSYLDYAYPGVLQKLSLEQTRQREAEQFNRDQVKKKAIEDSSGLWANFISGSYDGLYMGDFGSNVKAGNSDQLLDSMGCHLIASARAAEKLGKNIDILSAAKNAAYFNSEGDLQPDFFTDYGITAGVVEGRTAINTKIQELQSFDKSFVLVGAAQYGDGYHSVSITNLYVAPNGGFEVLTQETSRNGIAQRRRYGLQVSSEDYFNYYQIEKLYYFY